LKLTTGFPAPFSLKEVGLLLTGTLVGSMFLGDQRVCVSRSVGHE